jgi:hypothetical protein
MSTLTMVKGGNVGRINDIANQIRNTCLGITEDHREMVAHSEAVKALSGSLQNQRLMIAQQIADMSSAGKWTDSDIKEAAKRAVKGAGNDGPKDSTEKTLATFISEVKLFALPKLREQAKVIIEACETAWGTEVLLIEATKSVDRSELDTPVHKFTKRLYHLTMTVARAVKDGLNIQTAEDVVNYCRLNDPDFDYTKVAQRIENIITALQGVARDFGDDDVALAAEHLGNVTADQLMRSRTAMIDNERITRNHETATTVVSPATNPAAGEPAEGAVNILGDLMEEAA